MLPTVCIIGCDYSTQVYIEKLEKHTFVVKCLFDFENSKLGKQTASKYGLRYVEGDFEKFLLNENFELAMVFGSPRNFPAAFKKAFTMGKHVLINHVMGLDLIECMEMNNCSNQYRQLLSAVLNPIRMNPAFKAARELVSKNSLENINMIDCQIECPCLFRQIYESWMVDRTSGGGLLTQTVSLYIDALGYIFKKKIASINCSLYTSNSNPLPDVPFLVSSADDMVFISAELEDTATPIHLCCRAVLNSSRFCHKITVFYRDFTVELADFNLKTIFLNQKNGDRASTFDISTVKSEHNVFGNNKENQECVYDYGVGKSVDNLLLLFSESQMVLENSKMTFQNFNSAIYVRMVLDACIESFEEQRHLSVISQLLRAEKELNYREQLESKICNIIRTVGVEEETSKGTKHSNRSVTPRNSKRLDRLADLIWNQHKENV